MTLIEQIIREEIEFILEGQKNKRGGSKRGQQKAKNNGTKIKVNKNTNLNDFSNTVNAQQRNTNNNGTRVTDQNPQTEEQPQTQEQPQTEEQPQSQQTSAPLEKPTEEPVADCESNDYVGKCINMIKKKIGELYVGWPKSLFSMNEDDDSKKDKDDVDSKKNKSDVDGKVKRIIEEFADLNKKATTVKNIRDLFAKLFELWTVTNTDNAKDYGTKCNAVKKNLKNYRKIFTTYRTRFINMFRKLDINKSQLQREYKLMEDDITCWKENMNTYSPKIREMLRDHITILDSCMSTYKAIMFWYFKAPKFMRRNPNRTGSSKSSSDKWSRRSASWKKTRQSGRKAVKSYFSKGPTAGGSTGGSTGGASK